MTDKMFQIGKWVVDLTQVAGIERNDDNCVVTFRQGGVVTVTREYRVGDGWVCPDIVTFKSGVDRLVEAWRCCIYGISSPNQIPKRTVVATSPEIAKILAFAKQHGADSEPDHECGDLIDALQAVDELLTPHQRDTVLTWLSEQWGENLDEWCADSQEETSGA